ncbi:MAG TPA: hypothetical protein VGM92_04810, partial [Candidatus Kapabacteria bacterium]
MLLSFLAAALIGITAPRAQSNAEYSFRQQSVVDGQAFNNNGDPVPILSMDCLAANGYGQWTMSSQPGVGSFTTGSGTTSGATEYPPGWFLLPNGLYSPSTHHDPSYLDPNHVQCIPPGVVQCGEFDSPMSSETEVTANLDGTVDYVWPDRTTLGTPFLIKQFTNSEVDLSLSYFSNPQPVTQVIPTATGNMNVVTGTLHDGSSTTAKVCGSGCPGACTHSVISGLTQFQDEFQVASDAHYLYIVWSTSENLCSAPLSEVWATVVDLTTRTTVAGWPKLLGPGQMPTVACDPRNNRTSPSPAFEAAWIQPNASPGIARITCTAGSLGSSYTLPLFYINPSGTTKIYNTI